ncbi:D-glycero-beta-D-manno-heptose 1,7-bisphosphate 7-phosphatase [Candidatus Poribacteria bacterium]|nr:D-glycero-beta-D-manno-heptose 1,7-bisphosphate 7-phosphatase [Candidatus Poribacteria bacterium]
MRRAIFLDRDGVINEKMPEGQYVTRWEEFRFLPDVAEVIRTFNDMGFLVVVVTNQRGIAKGLYTEEDLEEIHRRMSEEIERSGGRIDAIYYCPHDIHENCNCRKPKPGMILKAAEELKIDLSSSYLIGDSITDIQSGEEAGVGVNILVSREARADDQVAPDLIVSCLKDAVDEIVSRETRDTDI